MILIYYQVKITIIVLVLSKKRIVMIDILIVILIYKFQQMEGILLIEVAIVTTSMIVSYISTHTKLYIDAGYDDEIAIYCGKYNQEIARGSNIILTSTHNPCFFCPCLHDYHQHLSTASQLNKIKQMFR